LLQELENAMRKASSQGAMFAKIVADRAGISAADMDCIDFVNVEGRMTAGRLAELTGLTTGAITGVIDRLEKAGFVRRERDESDRRKVFISVVEEKAAEIGKFYVPMQEAMYRHWSNYTDDELQLLLRFANDGYKGVLEATEALKAVIDAPPEKRASLKASPKSRR
jgi:DNA-binding MarR family transcriptional regulator